MYQTQKNKNSNLGRMWWLKNMFQTEQQGKTTEGLSEVETGNLPEKEVRVVIVYDDQRTRENNGCTKWEAGSF